ncbi:hypothetical protein ARMGADRAFT_1036632 [Armillaria gallica]|uniref:Uncharacterized protein n=1 Tax=Armillaria gallica TaxID=47427 RepID=A0A2H3CPZ5_ARMGA|nr:hypothetical protein ARMGADRAFT_1036632 [Armillaria gallica]
MFRGVIFNVSVEPMKQQVMTLLLVHEHEEWQHDMKRAYSLDSLAQFLFNGMDIEYNVCIHEEHSSDRSMDKIEKQQEKLSLRLKVHQQVQKQLMPIIYAQYIDKEVDTIDINNNNNELLLPEDVLLYLPSAFTAMEYEKLKVVSLGVQEGKLHEAVVYNAIISFCNAIKDVAVTKKNNQTHDYTQAMHMCYHDEVFQIIMDKDIFYKDTSMKCNIGNTYHNDGHMLAMPISEIAVEDNMGIQGHTWLTLDDDESKSKQPADDVSMEAAVKQETGWAWKFHGKNKWTDKEICKWEEEGDREQWELHQAEFDHLLLALDYMKSVWSTIAINCCNKTGYAEAATQKQAMYMKMKAITKVQLENAGYKHLLDLLKDQPFWLHIATQREDLERAIAHIQMFNDGLRHMVQRISNEACEVFKQAILNIPEVET